jgi:hypothetical protein
VEKKGEESSIPKQRRNYCKERVERQEGTNRKKKKRKKKKIGKKNGGEKIDKRCTNSLEEFQQTWCLFLPQRSELFLKFDPGSAVLFGSRKTKKKRDYLPIARKETKQKKKC